MTLVRGPKDSLGLPAYVVQELILASEHRGRGYGAHLTTLLARALPEEETVLIGTIHAKNKGAMQSASSAGRMDVGGWFQVAI
jgi:L-amino acid N-acyltransferase YncA